MFEKVGVAALSVFEEVAGGRSLGLFVLGEVSIEEIDSRRVQSGGHRKVLGKFPGSCQGSLARGAFTVFPGLLLKVLLPGASSQSRSKKVRAEALVEAGLLVTIGSSQLPHLLHPDIAIGPPSCGAQSSTGAQNCSCTAAALQCSSSACERLRLGHRMLHVRLQLSFNSLSQTPVKMAKKSKAAAPAKKSKAKKAPAAKK